MITEAHLDEILHIKSDINYWQELAAKARSLPLVHGMWLEGEGEEAKNRWLHEELNLDPTACHRLMIEGITNYADQQIAGLRKRLKDKGIMLSEPPPALPAPQQPTHLALAHVSPEKPVTVPAPPVRKSRRRARAV